MACPAEPVAVPLPGSYQTDPSPLWASLRERRPVSRATTVARHEVWLVTRYSDVRTVLADPRFSRAAAVRPGGPHAGAVAPRPGTLTALDPPAHTHLRRLVSPPFAPRRVELWRPWIASLARRLVADMVAAGEPADVRARLALPLSLAVMGRLLGVPDRDRDRLEDWSARLYSLEPSDPGAGEAAYDGLCDYLADLIARRRAEPAAVPDLLDDLLAAESGNGTDGALAAAELVGFTASLLVAGFETTVSQLGAFVVELLRAPARWQRLVAEPELLGAAVEELLRINRLSETGQVRVALVDVPLSGVTIKAGDGVLAVIGAANRDPRAFPDPDRYLPERYAPGHHRGRAEQHLTFGHGPHFCLGAQLARIELVEALRALLDLTPGLRLAVPAEQIRWRRTLIRGPQQVPVVWGGRPG